MSIERSYGNTGPLGPHEKDRDALRAAFEESERGEFLDAATADAYLRWLATGEGACPWSPGSSD